MKKIICLFLIVCTTILVSNFSFAADRPIYDETYENFYANGTDITIAKDTNDNTVITWEGGSQIVPDTVTVFSGGSNGTTYENTNIVMEDGTVSHIVAGGVSIDEENPATVTNGNVTINGGTVTKSVSGGGYVYSEVENTNITINGGTIEGIVGGGLASATVNGVYYNVGTEEEPQNSPNRVENAQIVINDGEINLPELGYGLLYGGGQGYSYVGNTDLTINGGDLSNAYVTAGGSNGYTGNANVTINGGDIGFYQSVNRGIVEDVELKVTGGNIEDLYVGAETDAADATGTVNRVTANLLAGTIENLEAGKSNSEPITIDNKNYFVTKTDTVNIVNDEITSGEIEISYDINVVPETLNLKVGESRMLQTLITTTPAGYEELFQDQVTWETSNENIVAAKSDGIVTGKTPGTATITATVLDKQDTAEVTVENINWFILTLLIFLLLAVLILLVIYLIG